MLSARHTSKPYASRRVDVWYDMTNIQNGRLLTQEIQHQLQQRSVLIVMVTPAALQSFWVDLEINAFLDYMARDRSREVLLIKLASCEMPGVLNAFTWINATNQPFTKTVEAIVQVVGTSEQLALPMSAPPPLLPT
jgi:hypothetical protein